MKFLSVVYKSLNDLTPPKTPFSSHIKILLFPIMLQKLYFSPCMQHTLSWNRMFLRYVPSPFLDMLYPLLCLLNSFSCFRFQIKCNFWETFGNFPDFIRSLFISYHTIIYFSFVASNTVALSYLLWNIIIYIHYLTMNTMK